MLLHRSPKLARSRRDLIVVSLLFMLIAPSCGKKKEPNSFVARVNNERLTSQEVEESVDASADGKEAQIRDFVTQWVNSALLYQEAKARGLDRSTEVNETLEEVKRQLAINRLIETEVYNDRFLQATDEELRAYYDRRKSEYLLGEDVAKVQYLLFSSREAAVAFRSQIVRGKSWLESLQSLSQDSAFAASIVNRVDSQYIKQTALSSKNLWEMVSQLRIGKISPIVKSEVGYYIVNLLGMQQKGGLAEFPLVMSEVRDRVLLQKQQKGLEQFLEDLKKKYSVQVNLAASERTDTTRGKK